MKTLAGLVGYQRDEREEIINSVDSRLRFVSADLAAGELVDIQISLKEGDQSKIVTTV